MARLIVSVDPSLLKVPLKTLGMAPASCPTAKSLEDVFYPDLRVLTLAILSLIERTDIPESALPPAGSMVDFYKHFKGPF